MFRISRAVMANGSILRALKCGAPQSRLVPHLVRAISSQTSSEPIEQLRKDLQKRNNKDKQQLYGLGSPASSEPSLMRDGKVKTLNDRGIELTERTIENLDQASYNERRVTDLETSQNADKDAELVAAKVQHDSAETTLAETRLDKVDQELERRKAEWARKDAEWARRKAEWARKDADETKREAEWTKREAEWAIREAPYFFVHLRNEFHGILFKKNPQLSKKRRIFFHTLNQTLIEYEEKGIGEELNEFNPAHMDGLLRFDQSGYFKLIFDFYESNGLSKSDYFFVSKGEDSWRSYCPFKLRSKNGTFLIEELAAKKDAYKRSLCPERYGDLIRLIERFLDGIEASELGKSPFQK